MKDILITILIPIIIMIPIVYFVRKGEIKNELYRNSLNICDRAEYDIQNSFSVAQENAATLYKMSLIMEGKCK